MFEIKGKYTTAKVMIDNVEESCVAQINGFINHPAFTKPVAIMPDTHAGKGSVIGFTMPITEKIIPQTIGVDIGCGMLSINIGKTLPVSLDLLDLRIRKNVPFGMSVRSRSDGVIHFKNDFDWNDANATSSNFFYGFRDNANACGYSIPKYNMEWFEGLCDRIGLDLGRAINSVATLGGGNHFIEIGQSPLTKDFWLTIHTGSRNLGKRVCDYWQNIATKIVKKEKQDYLDAKIKEIRSTYTGMEIKTKIREAREDVGLDVCVNDGLHYLEGFYRLGYFSDMIFAQKYAEMNRKFIGKVICEEILKIKYNEIEKIETVHNFIDFHDFIIRKGSVRSYVGEKFILPFNMRDGILICEGKSNPEWNFSSPHGAGRLMSRTTAKKSVDLEEFKKSMEGIFSTSVGRGTLDESPMAYKDSKIIEEAIEPTAKILDRIKPILNLKDSGGAERD